MSGSVLSAWLAGDEPARALLGPDLAVPDERARFVRLASQRRISPHLATALREQSRALPASIARERNVDALATGNAAAIVTGQQVGLFLGPLFTFYKAASAIVLARALEGETGVRCVPVFWVQNEDHDFLEINHAWLPGPVKVALPDDEARMSVAHRLLGAELEPVLAAMEAQLAGLPDGAAISAMLREAYAAGRTLSAAFTHLLASCFADEGLVFVDPRDPAVAALSAPILHRALAEQDAIEAALRGRSRVLAERGWSEQVPLRSGSPLCFYHLRDAAGPRHRIERCGTGYAVLGSDEIVPEAEVRAAEPLRLSSSALLRPIVQDALLPTAAYVGGPGELAYFAQLAPLYLHFALPQPMFALRARLRLVDAHTQSLLQRASLLAAEVEQPRARLLARAATSPHPPGEVVRENMLAQLHAGLDELGRIAHVLDENLLKPIGRTRESVDHAVTRLLERYDKARAEKDAIAVDRVTRLQAMLYPNEVPQERLFGLPWFAAKHGLAHVKQQVLAAIDPFSTEIRDVSV